MLEFREGSVVRKTGSPFHLRLLIGVLALFGLLHAQAGWSQSTCTWNQNGPGLWDNPSNWNGCLGGNGSPTGTPGPADHAVIGNIAPLADIDLGSTARNVDRLTLSAGRIFGDADITVVTSLNWTGGTIDGGTAATQLVVDSASNSDIAGTLHILAKRDLRIFGTLTWSAGDIELREDAEIDIQGPLIIDHSNVIRSDGRGGPVPLELRSDFSPQARIHNSSTPGARIEKLGDAMVSFARSVTFDNGNDVLVTDGTLQINGPGGDFGAYQVAATARLEFGQPTGVIRELTGSAAISGAGTLHKFSNGELNISGGYALTGPTEVVGGDLSIDIPSGPLTLPRLLVRAPGILTIHDDLVISNVLTWDGGEINGAGLSLTVPSGATATVSLDDLHTEAVLRSFTLINQGSVLISATGNGPTSASFLLESASIDNQGDFELRSNNQSNLVLDCLTVDCGNFANRVGATLRLNDLQGIVVVGGSLANFNNEGVVDLIVGCGQINAPGVDTGTYRYDSNCTLAFFTRPDTERVFESTLVLDPVNSSGLQLGGSLRVNGAARSFGNLLIDNTATLFGPAAITFTSTTEWRGLIEGTSGSETVTVAPGATLQTNSNPGDSPLLFARTLFNNGNLNINNVRLRLDGNAEIRNSGVLNLFGTSMAAGAIGCASPPNCGLITNNSGASIVATAITPGPVARLETDIAVANQGTLRVNSGVLELESNYTAAAGSVLDVAAGAGLRRSVGNLALAAGTLRGAGVIEANVDADGVFIEPAGTAAGNLGILGNFTATANTAYHMGIAGTTPPAAPRLGDRSSQPEGVPTYDRLTISGNASLNGTLDVIDLGYTASGSDVFDLMLYASRNGSVIAGLNPYSGVGLNLQQEATRLRLAAAAGGGCVWNPAGGGANNWTNPLKWNNCTGGAGPGPGPVGTPGAPDTAIVGGGSNVNLDVPVTVAELQFTGGSIGGPSGLTISSNLIWTGGSFFGGGGPVIDGGSSLRGGGPITLDVGANATLSGGQHNIDSITFALNGSANWTTGLIQLANGGVLQIGSSGVLNSNPSLAFESIFGSGTGIPEVRNGGAINKLGPNYSGIGQSVQYSGTGSISVSAGDFTFAANSPSALSGSYTAAAGATLQFVGGDRSFTTGATLTGGNLVFGDSSPMPGINVVNTCIGAGSAVIIRNAELVLNCAGTSDLAVLQMAEPLAVLEGSSAIRVSGSMGWSYGTIRGTGLTQLFEIAPGAVAQFDAPQGDQIPRILSNRRLRNFGTISWIAANATEVNDGAQFANESGGQLFLAGNGARAVASNAPATSLMLNNGTLTVDDGAQGDVDVAFDNSGSVQLTNGSLRLHRAGSDSGSYSIAAPSVLHLDGAARSMSASSVVSGAGAVGAVNGASVITSGTFEPHGLVIESGSTVEIDSASPQLIQTLFLQSGTLTGNAEIRIGTHFDWRNGGVVASLGASPGPLVIQPGALLDMCGGLCTLSNRVLRIEGMADWSGGSVEVPMGAAGKIAVALGGTLQTTPFKSAVRFRCAAPTCTAEMEVTGSLLQLGDGAELSLTSPLLVNGGMLRINGSYVQAPGVTLSGGTIELAGGDLAASPVVINSGLLRGSGQINGNVNNVAGRVQPGASPGRIDIFGTYTQGPSGILDIEVAGLAPGISSDFLFVSGSASIDGTLNVINGGYALTAPNTLDFLNSDSGLSGTFANTNIAYANYAVTYSGFTATLTPVAGPLIVNSTGDAGDGICDPDPGECTLRDALIGANLMPDPDVINFNIPAGQCTGPGGACVIVPLALLPQITTAISIDGYSQSGATPNSHAPSLGLGSNAVLKIELDGTSVPEFCGDGLIINAPSQVVTIRGLAIHHYCGGIVTFGPGDASYRISGNFIGLRADGSPAPRGNIVGIGIQGGSVIVGDTSAPAAGINVISGNIAQGISIQSIPTLSSLLVAGNLIGTAPNGVTALGNGLQGIAASTSAAIAGIYIGGDQPDERNVISGNVQDGIRFECTATVGNCFDGALVRGNYIGPGADGSVLGNIGNGINLTAMDAGRVTIGGTNLGDGNLIAYNGGNGILATFGGVGRASFLRNDIHDNGQLGIDLGGDGRTANDSGDGDTGPNGRLNFPTFTSYSAPGGNSAVINVLLGTPDIGGNYPARVDFYKAVADEPGVWLGTTTCAQSNVNCPASFAFPAGVTVTPDDVVLGIVTDGFGKSSEASFYGAATTIVSTTPEPSIIGTPYTVAVEVISPEPFAPIGSVSIDDGTGNSCQALLSPVSIGRSGGSCQLPSNAPAGARTVTAQYSYDNPLPPQPFTSSSAVVGHTINGPLPVVTSISPSSGNPAGGTVVTVNGTDFEVGSTTINFGAVPATGVSCASSVQCIATSPPGTGVVSVRATTSAGTSADTPADDYTYVCPATVVTSGNDSGVGSLRQVIADACPGSVVTFAGGVGTVDLTTAELFIGKDLSIDGGAGVVVARQAATPAFRIFTIGSGATVLLDSLSISNGNIGDDGAGIHNSGNLTVLDSVISGNASTAGNGGGGIANLGTLAVDNTTISLNSASFAGGGLLQINGGSATLTRCTLSGNSAPQGGAAASQSLGANASLAITSCTISGNSASTTAPALLNISTGAATTATMTLTNSTIANNTGTGDAITTGVNAGAATTTLHNNIYAGNSGNNVANVAPGVTTSVGNNLSDDATGGGGPGDLINTNPLLAPLGNYGGPTQTHALLPGSPAINAGDNVGAPATDQRGIVRPQLATVDIGAFESRGFALAVLSGTPQSAPVNTLFAQPLVVGVTANAVGEPVNGGQLLFTAPGAGATATFTNPAVIAAAQASITATANGIVGSYSVTAAAAGASGVPTFALQNALRATATSIGTIAPLVSVVGQPYTVTVSVLDGSTPVTTGTVEVRQLSDGTFCSINLASASSCQLVANSAITTAVRANYLGAGGFAPSQSATVSHGVDRAGTSVLIASDTPDPSQVLEPVLVTADISVTAPGAGTPTGEVLVTDGTASCSFILPARSCSFVPKALGVATLEARYLGDANFNASVDTEAHTIVVDGADLSIVKRNGLRLVPGGQPSTYILLVSNAGPQGVVNARVTDILPAQFANASWTCSAGAGASCPAAGAGTVDALVSLAAGSSVSFALTATAQAAPEQIVSNRATVTPPPNAPDPVSANNESTDTDPIGIFGEGFETEDE